MDNETAAIIHSGDFIIDLCPCCREHKTCEKVTIHTDTITNAIQCETCKSMIITTSLDELFDKAKEVYREAFDNESSSL